MDCVFKEFKGIWLPKELWFLDDLNLTEKVLLSVINSLTDADNGCFANNEYFAKLLGLSKGRISKIINALVKRGYLEIDFCCYSEIRKVEKRKIKLCLLADGKNPENAKFEIGNDQDGSHERPSPLVANDYGYSRKRPYPLVATDQDIKNIYKKNYIYNSSSQIFQMEKNLKKEEQKICHGGAKERKIFDSKSDPYLLARFLEKSIAANNPKFPKNEQQRQRWARDFDLMIRRDKINADDIAEVIAWSQKDSFWKSNILSGKKVREKYQQLFMRMNS